MAEVFYQTRNATYARALANALITTLKTDPAAVLLLTPFVILFTSGPAPISPDSVPGDFTEPTFTGYAPAALTIVGPVNTDTNTVAMHGEVNFTATAVVSPGQNILGYAVFDDDTTPTKMYCAEVFPSPVPIVLPGDFLSIDIVFPLQMQLPSGV